MPARRAHVLLITRVDTGPPLCTFGLLRSYANVANRALPVVLDFDLFAGFEDRDAKRKIIDKNYRLASGTPRFVVILGFWSTLDNELWPMKFSIEASVTRWPRSSNAIKSSFAVSKA
jgi:hypothetical protein